MPLNRYQRFAYRVFGATKTKTESNAHLSLSLRRAHLYLRPEVYLSYSYLNMVLVFVAGMVGMAVLVTLAAMRLVDLPLAVLVVLAPMPLVLAYVVYLLTYLIPDLKAKSRARDIEAKLPYALNYMSTMASAGATPDKIFSSLAKQPIYGEVANEAALISRDLRLLGFDLVTALTTAMDRSPSLRFQDFIQGAITTITSGGNLKIYFRAKADQFVEENRQDQKRFLESLGVLAESYVTVVVAGPVFLIVLLSVMMMVGGNGSSTLTLGYLMMFVLVPLAQLGFGFAISSITPEA